MTAAAVRVGVGTRFVYEGETVEIVELIATPVGNVVLLKSARDQRVRRIALKELLFSGDARVIPDCPASEDAAEPAGVVLGGLTEAELAELRARAEHVREVLTGYRSGHAELARSDEPRQQFDPRLPLESRYAAKAAELSITDRTIKALGAGVSPAWRGGPCRQASRTTDQGGLPLD
jgi:hypothetical protein